MKTMQGQFKGVDGGNVFFQTWQPDTAARAIVFLAHGAAEHSGRYVHVAQYFVERGYMVAALDHVGHGMSDGTPGFIESFDHYIQNLEILRSQVHAEHPHLPCILLGHSMGGLIAANALLDFQEKYIACVLSGPAIQSDVAPPAWQIFIIRVLSRWWPRLGVLQLDASLVSRDPLVVETYRQDRLVYSGKLSARQLVEMFSAMQRAQDHAHEITIPLLVLHGSADQLTAPSGSQFLYDHVGSTEKLLKIYPGLFHEIFNEPEQNEVLKDVLRWCDERL